MSEKELARQQEGGGPPEAVSDMAKSVPLLQRYATPTGLNLPEGLDLETWLTLGAELARAETALTWAIGDWWVYGEHHYGERIAIVSDPSWAGPSYQACKVYGSVARHFERLRRRNLSLGHHREVMGLPEADQDALLTWAEEPLRSGEPRPRSTSMLRERVREVREQARMVEWQPPRDNNGEVVQLPLEHYRQVGAAHGLTPKEQKVFEDTGSLAEALGCDFNYEKDKEEEWMTAAQQRAGAFQWQIHEIIRMAKECPLLDKEADPPTPADLALIKQGIKAWQTVLENFDTTAAARVQAPEGNKQERLAAVDQYIREAGLSEGDLLAYWFDQRRQQYQDEQQQREAERQQRTGKGKRLLAAMDEATQWVAGFCRKWGIEGTVGRQCYLDMAAYFELKEHQKAVKLEADKEAKLRQQIEALASYQGDEPDA